MRTVLAALGLMLAMAGPAPAAAPVRDMLIVPGERVGPIALGMKAAELDQAVGIPGQVLQQGKDTTYSWGNIVAQISDGSPGVDLITVNDQRYETAGHVRVGLASLALPVVLGQPDKKTAAPGLESLDYDGMTVVVRYNAVAQIRVHK
jgi:hypothetical protein